MTPTQMRYELVRALMIERGHPADVAIRSAEMAVQYVLSGPAAPEAGSRPEPEPEAAESED